jgi:outer membrane protein OmpA-like peptidoglycan-associated protein
MTPRMTLKMISLCLPLAFSASALAQSSDYSAKDIVKFFKEAKPAATRGICVGDGCEQDAGTGTTDPVPSFDLMVTFEKNSFKLTETAQNNLMQFSIALQNPELKSLRFAVEGFTDASGSDQHNMKLSQRRAESVVSFLGNLGIEAARLESKGFGETRMRMDDPLSPGNRRVETRILGE